MILPLEQYSFHFFFLANNADQVTLVAFCGTVLYRRTALRASGVRDTIQQSTKSQQIDFRKIKNALSV